MSVLDASTVVEVVINGPLAGSIRQTLAGLEDSFIAPHLIDIEVMSALRRLAAEKRIESHRFEAFRASLEMFPLVRYSPTPLLLRIWELRHNFTCYDATYIALAEATDSTLYTCDAKLKKGHRARVIVFTG